MNKLFYTLILVLSSILANAQSDVFILIDISGNPLNSPNKITHVERKQAIELCKQLLEGKVYKNQFVNWKSKNLDNFISKSYNSGNGDILKKLNSITIVPYGNKNTYKNFKIFQNSSPKVNLKQSIEYADAFTYTDQLTFGELARAKAADIAIDANIKSYFLIEISGLGGDQTGSKSLSTNQQKLIDEYKSSAVISPIGLFILNGKPLRVTSKIININTMAGNTNTSGSKGIITAKNVNKKSLKIISPIGSKSDYDEVDEKTGLVINWQCLGCKKNTKYTILAKNVKNKKTKKTTAVGRNNVLMQLEAGVYKISIKGKGLPTCQNNNQYVEVKGKANIGGWIFFISIILLAGAAFYIKKNDPFGWWDKTDKKTETENNDDKFDSLY